MKRTSRRRWLQNAASHQPALSHRRSPIIYQKTKYSLFRLHTAPAFTASPPIPAFFSSSSLSQHIRYLTMRSFDRRMLFVQQQKDQIDLYTVYPMHCFKHRLCTGVSSTALLVLILLLSICLRLFCLLNRWKSIIWIKWFQWENAFWYK